ncbi:protein GL2-INTERACTING REPRESSOR 1 [Beta vulgaris subsp. vulgaris]|uniref:protein GL2-INTERACTING REPRESSOR 1 n=1 Tax=Beta vulgaris subsp. vulgaris TaxID=3555 RepID=UPI002037628D|nr:protein GL2-INTERACTING REPRESSOR 1 [Beta vulgaris subsp. vulgaris]
MSFQLENSHPQPKNYKPFVSTTNILGDDVLVSKGIPITLDLFGIKQSPPRIKFQHDRCPVFKQGTFPDSKSNQKRYLEDHNKLSDETMSKRNNNMPKLDLKLNLSPPSSRMRRAESPSRSASVSPPSSCVSSEISMNSPETTSMVLVGCPRCLMYVMLSEEDPKCPKCKSTVLLDFMHDNNDNNNNNNNNNNNSSGSKKTRKN